MRTNVLDLLQSTGPVTAPEACRRLGVSQPTFSRLIRANAERILRVGQARATRYAARRHVGGVEAPVPVYEIGAPGSPVRQVATVHPVEPAGFLIESQDATTREFLPDLPWYLQDLRPSGFLGRLVPRRHPDLDVPPDVRLWTADHVLRYVTRRAWDLPGAFVLGDRALEEFLAHVERPGNVVAAEERVGRYPAIAEALLAFGDPGSSAAGEQPKFLATRADGDRLTPVLVKFSPPALDAPARRIADLLVAEHLALAVLSEQGFESPRSEVLNAGGRTFLEVERFDRFGAAHRRGVVSLQALDAGLLGSDQSSWTHAVEALATRRVVPVEAVERVRWVELFARLVGNTDRHFGNLGFLLDGLKVATLAPAYDMLPMHYHPRQGELPAEPYRLPVIGPREAGVAPGAVDAAARFWRAVAADGRVSEGFRRIAEADAERLRGLSGEAGSGLNT